jgi:hypothetical protein
VLTGHLDHAQGATAATAKPEMPVVTPAALLASLKKTASPSSHAAAPPPPPPSQPRPSSSLSPASSSSSSSETDSSGTAAADSFASMLNSMPVVGSGTPRAGGLGGSVPLIGAGTALAGRSGAFAAAIRRQRNKSNAQVWHAVHALLFHPE